MRGAVGVEAISAAFPDICNLHHGVGGVSIYGFHRFIEGFFTYLHGEVFKI